MTIKPDDELLTLAECAAMTKRKVATFRADIRARRIPYIRLGRLVRIRRSDLDKMLTRGFCPAIPAVSAS